MAKPTYFEKERGVTDVSVTRGISHVLVTLAQSDTTEDESRLALLKALAADGVPVFLVKLHPGAMTFAIRKDDVAAGEAVLQARNATYESEHGLALVSLYAGAMRDLSGVMAGIYEALVGRGIRVCQTGDAYNAVHVLVPGEDADSGAEALRAQFALNASEEPQPTDGAGLKSL